MARDWQHPPRGAVPSGNKSLFRLLFLLVPTIGKIMARKYSRAASKKVEKVMHERKEGTLKSGSGKKVKSRKQAIAIGLSEARKEGKKAPKKAAGKKS
jgi:hypothetical protein